MAVGTIRYSNLQDKPGEILVAGHFAQMLVDEVGGHFHRLLPGAGVGGGIGNLLQQVLHQGVQAPGADILGALVDLKADLRNSAHPVRLEFQFQALGTQQGPVLFRQ